MNTKHDVSVTAKAIALLDDFNALIDMDGFWQAAAIKHSAVTKLERGLRTLALDVADLEERAGK